MSVSEFKLVASIVECSLNGLKSWKVYVHGVQLYEFTSYSAAHEFCTNNRYILNEN